MKKILKPLTIALSATVLLSQTACGGGGNDEKITMEFYKNPYRINVTADKDLYEALDDAKTAQSTALSAGNDAVVITLPEGEYFLDKTLAITSDCTGELPLVFEGAGKDKTTISGGKSFTGGWKVHDASKGIYKIKLEGYSAFKQLYMGDDLGIRARYPNDNGNLSSDYLSLTWNETDRKLQIPAYVADDIAINSIGGCELHFVQEWTQSIGHIKDDSVALVDDKIEMNFDDTWFNEILFTRSAPIRNPHGKNMCWLEGSLALLDAENEWYFDDSTKCLYYKPKAGVDVNGIKFTVPQTETLFSLDGTPNAIVKNVVFTGLSIGYTNWNDTITDCYLDGQAGIFTKSGTEGFTGKSPACVFATFADGVTVFECNVKNTGAYAINLDVGVKNAKIVSNTIMNTATSGISMGYYGEDNDYTSLTAEGYKPASDDVLTEKILIQNNLVTKIGTSFKGGSTGIVGGFLRNLEILNNDIHDVSYSGIAIGWGWEWKDIPNCNVSIKYNKITNVMNHLLYDGAPIYLLARQQVTIEGSYIEGNYIEIEEGLGGIYFDNSSSCYTLKDNVIKGTGRIGVIDLHDWNYLLTNINITNTYVSTGKIGVQAYWSDPNKTTTPPALLSRNVTYDEAIKAFENGKWSRDAQKIIDKAGLIG